MYKKLLIIGGKRAIEYDIIFGLKSVGNFIVRTGDTATAVNY